MSSKRTIRILVGAGLFLLGSTYLAVVNFKFQPFSEATAATAPETKPAVPVTVTTVQPKAVTSWREFSGRLEAVERVEIRPRVAGAIQLINFREGALVKAGDVLITIDPAPYDAAVAQATAEVAAAQSRLDLAKLEVDRAARLSKNQTISQSEVDQRQASHSQAFASLTAAQAALQTAQLNRGYTDVRAPISGRVGKREITAGNLVAAGSSPTYLTTIVSIDPIYASFNADEGLITRALSQLPASEEGLPPIDRIPVQIGTSDVEGTPIVGRLQLIDNEVRAASGTIRVRAVFDNPGGRLMPGQFVRVRMGEPVPESRVLISDRAVGTDQDRKFVFKVDGENKVAYQSVELGETIDGLRIVKKGLIAGDRVIVDGLPHVGPGALVAPQDKSDLAAQ